MRNSYCCHFCIACGSKILMPVYLFLHWTWLLPWKILFLLFINCKKLVPAGILPLLFYISLGMDIADFLSCCFYIAHWLHLIEPCFCYFTLHETYVLPNPFAIYRFIWLAPCGNSYTNTFLYCWFCPHITKSCICCFDIACGLHFNHSVKFLKILLLKSECGKIIYHLPIEGLEINGAFYNRHFRNNVNYRRLAKVIKTGFLKHVWTEFSCDDFHEKSQRISLCITPK